MNGTRMSRPLVGPAVALTVLGSAVAGCSTGAPEQPPRSAAPQMLSVGQVCAGLFPDAGEGGKALERVLESTRFQVREEQKNPDVRAVAQAMEEAYRSGRKIGDMPQPVCEVVGADKGSRVPTARVMFTAYSKQAADPADLPGTGARDVRVSTRKKHVDLTYDCVSSRVGSTQDIPLQITLAFQERWDESKGDAVLGPDYLAVTHSAALAVAQELECVNNAGLPARADGLPKPEAGS
ncbi:hypothetical protein ACFW6F_18880 [Streptomyces sp. NPDC058746]|uniref:hypothetical protein n=1 Tax=Streptomyces sp. NPDC058746 TaxID=3346622 RepID=UPI0036809707